MTKNIVSQIKSFQQEPQIIKLRVNETNAMYSIHRVVVQQLHQQRQGNANCKTRSEVKGGGKKPWKQKGTGRARAGSIRSPLWRGGGVIFGPKTKKYKLKVNKKEKNLAISNMLYNKKDSIISLKSSFLHIDKPKTKYLLNKLKDLNIPLSAKILIIMVKKNLNTYLATRNLINVEIIQVEQINLLSIIKAEYIIVEHDAINIINNRYKNHEEQT